MVKTINGKAIWGMFADENMNYLKRLQSKANKKLRGPSFEIHLTLSSPNKEFDEKKIYQIKKICEKVKPIEITPCGLAKGDNFFYLSFFRNQKNTRFIEIERTVFECC